MRPIPAPTLTALSALLSPYVPDVSPMAIVAALRQSQSPAPADPTARRALTIEEAAGALGVSYWSIRRRVMDGTIAAAKLGGRGQWRIPITAIEAFQARAETEAAERSEAASATCTRLTSGPEPRFSGTPGHSRRS